MTANPIVRSVLVVSFLWYCALHLSAETADLADLPFDLARGVVFVLLGLLLGAVTSTGVSFLGASNIASALRPSRWSGLNITAGQFPTGRSQLARKKLQGVLPDQFEAWLKSFSAKHPAHAALLRAVAETMNAKPKFPASPVPGGHGNLSLLQHSVNVAISALGMAKDFSYDGHRNRSGAKVFDLIDHEYVFDRTDPVIPVAAFSHDIGKLIAFSPLATGGAEVIREAHDLEGKMLLLSLPEFWELPFADREVLMLSVIHHHHISDLPGWATDRTRAMVELVAAADIASSQSEGAGDASARLSFMAEEPEAQQLSGFAMNTIREMVADEIPPDDEQPDQQDIQPVRSDTHQPKASIPAQVIATPAAIQPQPEDSEGAESWAFDTFTDLLAELGRINGNDKSKRVGFKYGEWVYVSDALLRGQLAEKLRMPSLETLPTRGQMHPVTHEILERLLSAGALMDQWEGMSFSTKRALFKVVVHGAGGKVVTNFPFTIIFRASLFSHLARLPDCRYPPSIASPGWGETSAINKKAAKDNAVPNTSDEGDSAASPLAGSDLTGDDLPFDLPVLSEAPSGHPLSEREVASLRLRALQMDPLLPFKAVNDRDGIPHFYFPEEAMRSLYLIEGDDLPNGAVWAKGKSGERYIGIPQ